MKPLKRAGPSGSAATPWRGPSVPPRGRLSAHAVVELGQWPPRPAFRHGAVQHAADRLAHPRAHHARVARVLAASLNEPLALPRRGHRESAGWGSPPLFTVNSRSSLVSDVYDRHLQQPWVLPSVAIKAAPHPPPSSQPSRSSDPSHGSHPNTKPMSTKCATHPRTRSLDLSQGLAKFFEQFPRK